MEKQKNFIYMSQHNNKCIGNSEKYKGVYIYRNRTANIVYHYSLKIKGIHYQGIYDTEHEAAKQYDIKLIENGKKPVNVLKPK